MGFKDMSLEEIIFQFLDQSKFLFYPEKWNRTFMDYSKNEAFTLFLLYRKEQVNMTEIAEYLKVPLNTATGIVSRLEKRGVVLRERDRTDKRIVVVKMSPEGREFIKEQIKVMEYYLEKVMAMLTREEKELAVKLFDKVFYIFKNNASNYNKEEKEHKKVKRILIE